MSTAFRRNRSRKRFSPIGSTHPLVKLWVLRMLVPLNGCKKLSMNPRFMSEGMEQLLKLTNDRERDILTSGFEPDDASYILNTVKSEHEKAEKQAASLSLPVEIQANIKQLAQLIELSPVDCNILGFVISLHNEQVLEDAADYLGELSWSKVLHVLSVVLDIAEADVRDALSLKGALVRSGLVRMSRRAGGSGLRHQFELLSDNFASFMTSQEFEPLSLLRDTVTDGAKSELALADFDHIKNNLNLLIPYLEHAIKTKKAGVNIYLHGVPGTGKTELARVLANRLKVDLFEVANQDECGDPVNAVKRLRSYNAAQSLLAKRQAIIVFDEVEDVFGGHGNFFFARPSLAQDHKAWVNQTLEQNPVPTIWVSNSLGLDPAFARRFDMVIELDVPPRSKRKKIIKRACEGLVDDDLVSRLAEIENLAPAVITRASQVVKDIEGKIKGSASDSLELLISNTLKAQGHVGVKSKNDPTQLPALYDPAFVNADNNLAELAKGIKQAGSARLCLYGPPGTGKTAYVHWLAQQLNKPLMIKRASDILSKWVGENEKNIAQAFAQAQSQDAVLLIDEVDSLLADRRNARHNWEVSQVNEMLTHMEAFDGVFVASTNLVTNLDQASLRRFDLKVKFNFLLPKQAQALLKKYAKQLGLGAPTQQELLRLNRLPLLTPGDFAAINRRQRFSPIKTVGAFVDALAGECELKDGVKNVIGFV